MSVRSGFGYNGSIQGPSSVPEEEEEKEEEKDEEPSYNSRPRALRETKSQYMARIEREREAFEREEADKRRRRRARAEERREDIALGFIVRGRGSDGGSDDEDNAQRDENRVYGENYQQPNEKITNHTSKKNLYRLHQDPKASADEKNRYSTGWADRYVGLKAKDIIPVLENRSREGVDKIGNINNIRYKSKRGHFAAIHKNRWSMWVKRYSVVYRKMFAEAMCDPRCKEDYLAWKVSERERENFIWRRPDDWDDSSGEWDGNQRQYDDLRFPRLKQLIPEYPLSVVAQLEEDQQIIEDTAARAYARVRPVSARVIGMERATVRPRDLRNNRQPPDPPGPAPQAPPPPPPPAPQAPPPPPDNPADYGGANIDVNSVRTSISSKSTTSSKRKLNDPTRVGTVVDNFMGLPGDHRVLDNIPIPSSSKSVRSNQSGQSKKQKTTSSAASVTPSEILRLNGDKDDESVLRKQEEIKRLSIREGAEIISLQHSIEVIPKLIERIENLLKNLEQMEQTDARKAEILKNKTDILRLRNDLQDAKKRLAKKLPKQVSQEEEKEVEEGPRGQPQQDDFEGIDMDVFGLGSDENSSQQRLPTTSVGNPPKTFLTNAQINEMLGDSDDDDIPLLQLSIRDTVKQNIEALLNYISFEELKTDSQKIMYSILRDHKDNLNSVIVKNTINKGTRSSRKKVKTAILDQYIDATYPAFHLRVRAKSNPEKITNHLYTNIITNLKYTLWFINHNFIKKNEPKQFILDSILWKGENDTHEHAFNKLSFLADEYDDINDSPLKHVNFDITSNFPKENIKKFVYRIAAEIYMINLDTPRSDRNNFVFTIGRVELKVSNLTRFFGKKFVESLNSILAPEGLHFVVKKITAAIDVAQYNQLPPDQRDFLTINFTIERQF